MISWSLELVSMTPFKKGKGRIRNRGFREVGSRRREAQMTAGLAARPTCWGASELLGRVSYFTALKENEAQRL